MIVVMRLYCESCRTENKQAELKRDEKLPKVWQCPSCLEKCYFEGTFKFASLDNFEEVKEL